MPATARGPTRAASRRTTRRGRDRFLRFEELRRRWDEEHAKIKALVLRLKIKAEYNDGMASQYKAAQTRLRKFEEAGPPTEQPREQAVQMRLKGGRTGKRAVICEDLELTGLMKPFDLEVWYGERVAVLGSNGSGKSHFLRLLARGGTDPDVEHRPVEDTPIEPVRHTGKAKLGARVRPGWFVQTHEHPELVGRTLLEILHRGDGRPDGRTGMGREQAARVLDRYELAHASEQQFESLSGGQQARFQILLLELSGATLLLLDEPTDNLDVQSAEALEAGLEAFDGTVRRGDPRPVVRARLRPVPGLRRRRRGLRDRRAGLGRGPGAADPMSHAADRRRSTRPTRRCSTPFHDVYAAALRHGPQGEFSTRVAARRGPRRDGRIPTSGSFRIGWSGWSTADRAVATGWMRAPPSTTPTWPRSSLLRTGRARPRVRRRDARPRRGAGPGRGRAPAGRRGGLALRGRRRRRRVGRTWRGPAQGFELGAGRRAAPAAAARSRPTRLDALAAEAAAHHEGYTLRSFTGPVPDDLVEGWAALSATLMTEAPMGDIEREVEAAGRGPRSAPRRR